MTPKLSQERAKVAVSREMTRRGEGVAKMNDIACPWCESKLDGCGEGADEQQCPECLTTWCYEEAEFELPLAA